MREHCRNAQAVSDYLDGHPQVSQAKYPRLHADAEQRRRADTYLQGGYGGLVGFELQGGKEAGRL